MTPATTTQPQVLVAQVQVTRVERISPAFARVELGGPALADFGVEGPLYDQRIKIILPPAHGDLPTLSPHPTWYAEWRSLPEQRRGHLRTYTVREVRGRGCETRLVVDFVLHGATDGAGPGTTWAAGAGPGDRVVVVAPSRGAAYGGIEFAPESATELLLAADETAVPALCGILRDLDPDARGTAFAEVPTRKDIQPTEAPAGVRVVWLPRDGARRGVRQVEAVRRHVGLAPAPGGGLSPSGTDAAEVWETPTYSAAGEPVDNAPRAGTGRDDLYAWVAGESGVVTTLRRALVHELGMPRRRVAFMGYWREGVAMRS